MNTIPQDAVTEARAQTLRFSDISEEALAAETTRLKRLRNATPIATFKHDCYDELVKLANRESAHRVRLALGV